MCSHSLRAVLLLVTLSASGFAQLRVCADPANLPFSNRAQQGFENRIAEVLARATHQKLEYEWQRMGRGFVRDVLNKHKCDVVLGVPQNFRPMLTTAPYYRSSYVFVTRKTSRVQLSSFDDPSLKNMKLGVQIVSEEYAPPAQALGRRGLVANIVGFESTGEDAPSIINAVLRKRIDAAVVWGPLAGYFGRQHASQLRLSPTPPFDAPGLPLAFSISMGVRKHDEPLREELDGLLAQHRTEIDRILRDYGVPLLPISSAPARSAH